MRVPLPSVTLPQLPSHRNAHAPVRRIADGRTGIRERLPVYFLTELIGLALGLSFQELQIDRHFTDSVGLIKELGLI